MQSIPTTTNGAPKSAPKPSRMTAANIVRGKIDLPPRCLVYAREKVGKSTFAAGAPGVIFLASEQGTKEFDIERFPEVQTWPEVFEACDYLLNAEHSYQTLAIDTIDWLQAKLFAHIIATDTKGKRTMAEACGGYGKSYDAAVDEWRRFARRLDELNERRHMTIILLAHAKTKKFNEPGATEGWDRYELDMHEKGAAFWKQWVDCVLFANLEIATYNADSGKTMAAHTGARFIHTQPPPTAAFDAGSRYTLPDRLPLDWQAFESALRDGRRSDVDGLRAQVAELLPTLADTDQQKVTAALPRAGNDPTKLAKLVDFARARVAIVNAETPQIQTEGKVA